MIFTRAFVPASNLVLSFFFWPLDGSIEWSIYADAFTAIHGWHQDALFSCTQPEHRRYDDRSSALEWKIVT